MAVSWAHIVERATHGNARKWLARVGPVIALVFVFTLFAILRFDKFVTKANIEIMMLQTAVVGTAAIGMTLIIVSGGIDLSVGSVIALCTVVVALLLKAGAPPFLAAIGGIAAGSTCGLLTGTLVTRLRLMPFIVTLGMMGTLRGVAKGLSGERPIYPSLEECGPLAFLLKPLDTAHGWMLFPPGVWMMLVLAGIVAAMLRYTRLGRHIFAIGSNEQTARLCGVDVERVKDIVYTVGATFAGIAALLQFSYLHGGDPTTAGGYELNIIAAVVIGGASLSGGEGTIIGSLIGAIIMTVVANGCTKMGMPNWVQEIVTGIIIIAAVTLDKLRHRNET